MAVYAISDLHLPARKKPMDIFGSHWENHFERISEDWRNRVDPEDIVLLPGDLSWAMHLEEAIEDINSIAVLPGEKVILRGNHDYWWSAIGKVRRTLPEGMYALQNDFIVIGDNLIAGSRGWTLPNGIDDESADAKIFKRERIRLEMSLRAARNQHPYMDMIVMMHYPPVYRPFTEEGCDFTDILEKYRARHCIYGHLHGAGLAGAFMGDLNGVTYHQVSCDRLNFRLYKL